ncbi:MAG: hypothetical protein A3E88_00435 [Legionellales bacterium RIFCSPHIGHO2_12_FULL_35_11]|nr:MAG: hypothetical protein A3E88_00435 [Legionellales bacterium RIFCSPHIGHO2_12_FULL_35_11]
MKLIFLGVSSALTIGYKKFQSNMVLTSSSGKNLLIDCGSDIKHSLIQQNFSHNDIDAVYISHLHADHVGGMEWLGLSKLFIDKKRPKLYICSELQKPVWENVLKGGMSTLEDIEAKLDSFFDIQTTKGNKFSWEGYDFNLVRVFHSMSNNKRLPCYGLSFIGDKEKVFLSTDARFAKDELISVYKDSTIIFHDCETSKIVSGQHASYEALNSLDRSIKEKMWLYDYADGDLPDAVADGFRGFVVQGQTFDV